MNHLFLVILDGYAEHESAYLASWLHYTKERHGMGVKTVNLTGEPVRSFGCFLTVPDMSVQEALSTPFAAITLIGGTSWRTPEAEEVKHLVVKAVDSDKPIGAICDATTFLGRHGFLNNRQHTSNTLEDLKTWAGTSYTNELHYINEQAVSDRGLVTANGTAPLEFAALMLKELHILPEKEIDDLYHFHKNGFYAHK